MLLFCPSCSNMLTVTPIPASHTTHDDASHSGKNRFECRTCPYQMVLDRRYYERRDFTGDERRRGVEDVLGGEGSWRNVERTGVDSCPDPTCDSKEAHFKQAQIRSADEPMTTFYRCVKCASEWRSND